MIYEHKRNTNIGVGLGVIMQLAGKSMSATSPTMGFIVVLLGIVLFVWGCGQYAKSKGYSGVWGFLGLFSLIGLIILVFMKDKDR
ncbi:hypothetical protein ONV78_06330 [Hahella sp. CR1]|uniref:hypothetical protein n=1 Tax=Hahella sp. CR1 TaxID=2992807 RepID=UPI002441547A|nr:hypothetical protein [Hahella sp. CR1]MDG9667351.1 hypothetical protein [Hahella sp. CR1]